MSVELIRKQMGLNEMTRRENVQVVKERDIIVPDGKPDMQRVLYLDGDINIDQIDVQEDRVVYKGQLDTTILYVPQNNSKEIYTMKGSIPLEDFVILDGVDSNQRIAFNYNIEHMHWNILNERKLNVKAIIGVGVEATKPKEVEIVTDVRSEGPIQTSAGIMSVVKPSQSGTEKLIVKDELTIPQGKPSIAEILKLHTDIKEEQIKRTDNEILYNGIVEICTMYTSQDEDKPVEVAKHRIPFSGSSDITKPQEEAYWNCELSVKPTYVQASPDYDGEDRIVEVECIVEAKYSTFDKNDETIVADVYCPGKKVTMTNTEADYMNLASKGTARASKKDMITLDNGAPDTEQIFSVSLKPIIDEKQVNGDKLTVSGVLEAKVVYIDPENMNMVQTAVEMIPFNQEFVCEGISKDAYVDVKVQSKDVEVSSYNKNDLMIDYTLDYVVNVYKKDMVQTINQINVEDMDKEELANYPSMTVYAAKKGDNLWSLAKRFNTTVQDIVEINDLDENTALNFGQKLIILKKTKF
ncbi:MAG: DUF3794 domain-containing protein [Niameybacter sp.]|uniref:DUF3794 and LysM peptidoglycan-binding domain-containing protein n=1 Tax=Niameybacter sp. TaxID=2033640 RepID=UPI002FC93964